MWCDLESSSEARTEDFAIRIHALDNEDTFVFRGCDLSGPYQEAVSFWVVWVVGHSASRETEGEDEKEE
jgi:hypothetical protein